MDEGTDSREAGDEARVPSGSAEGLLQGGSAGSVKERREGKRTSHAQTRLARRLLERAVRSVRAAPAAMAALGRALADGGAVVGEGAVCGGAASAWWVRGVRAGAGVCDGDGGEGCVHGCECRDD